MRALLNWTVASLLKRFTIFQNTERGKFSSFGYPRSIVAYQCLCVSLAALICMSRGNSWHQVDLDFPGELNSVTAMHVEVMV